MSLIQAYYQHQRKNKVVDIAFCKIKLFSSIETISIMLSEATPCGSSNLTCVSLSFINGCHI